MPTPLYRIAALQHRLQGILAPILRFEDAAVGGNWKQRALQPDAFTVTRDIDGQRVLLLEDIRVNGSTPLSAAMALHRAGARTLALVPIARMVYKDGITAEYSAGATAPIDFTRFPRQE